MDLIGDTLTGTMEMASAGARDVLSSVTGMGGNGLKPGEVALDLNTEPLEDEDEETKAERLRQLQMSKIGGLYNEGNTCFMNSVIQSLAALDSINGFLDDLPVQSGPSSVLRQLIKEVNTKTLGRHSFSTSELVKSMSNKDSRWDSYDQEDAQEFFQDVLAFIEKDIKANLPSDEKQHPRILTPFDGESGIRVGCLKCGETEGIRMGVTSSMGLSLSASGPRYVDLMDLFDEYTGLETIDGVECYRCSLVELERNIQARLDGTLPDMLRKSFESRLNQIREALKKPIINETQYHELRPTAIKELNSKSKQTMFARPTPKVLAVHINRSVFDPRTGYIRKNMSPVSFPLRLNLGPYVIRDPQEEGNLEMSTGMIPVCQPEAKNIDEEVTSDDSEFETEEEVTTEEKEPEQSAASPSGSLFTKDEGYESTLESSGSDQTLVDEEPPSLLASSSRPPVAATDSLPSADTSSPSDDSLFYRLKALIIHYGSHNYGHYVAYRTCKHGLWWRVSDQTVQQVDQDEVLGAQGQGVFMLFYEKEGERKARLDRDLIVAKTAAAARAAAGVLPGTADGADIASASGAAAVTHVNVGEVGEEEEETDAEDTEGDTHARAESAVNVEPVSPDSESELDVDSI